MHYRITSVVPERHLIEVRVTLDAVDREKTWKLPAWVPGSYLIRDFARHITTIHADADGEPLALVKQDKHTWRSAAPAQPSAVTLTFTIHAHDSSVRAAFLDLRYGFFDGTSVYLLPLGEETRPCEVEIRAPRATGCADWEVATGLEAVDVDGRGFGVYRARDWHDLIDRPVLMGHLARTGFDVEGHPHGIALSGRQHADLDRLGRDVAAICRTHAAMFGEVPMDHYTFLVRVTGDGRGGLEHRNSSSLACMREGLPRVNEPADKVREAYRDVLGLFSHEYFHSWNIKRIKPAAFTPYDFASENYTGLLWAFEGITSYYDDLALARSGVISASSYLEVLGQTLTRVARGRGRFKQTVTESSFDAWTRFYKQDANAPNAIVSYYTKGAWLALALDLTLRENSDGDKSLDDVMRLLWKRHGKTGVGVPENGIQAVAEEVLGESLSAFFEQALYSTEDIDLAPLLEPLGVRLHWRPAAGHEDSGGKAAEAGLYLGASIAPDPAGVRLRVLYEQGVAMQAGLAAGDVLVAVDHVKADVSNLDSLLAGFAVGDRVMLHVFRGDELLQAEVVLRAGERDFAWLEVAADGLTTAGRSWLQG